MQSGPSMTPLEAHQALLHFAQRRGTVALRLLFHAAVPQSLRPDLLVLIRTNFVPEADGNCAVEADVMLAPFCQALGSGYFQLDPEIRRQCLDHLADLESDPATAPLQQRVAALLLAFIEYCESRPGLNRDFLLLGWLEVQRWVAAAFLDPDATAIGLADALSSCAGAQEPVAAVQLGAVSAAVSLPLSNYPSLIAYAKGLGALHAGDRPTAQRLLESVEGHNLRFGTVELPPPVKVLGLQPADDVRDRVETTPSSHPYRNQRVFISYSRKDDERPPFDNKIEGWVTYFWQQLRFELTNAGMTDAVLWMDRYQIEPADAFTEKSESALREAHLFIAIVSPNYLTSEWCLMELQSFLKFQSDLGNDASSRLVVIHKMEVGNRALPPALLTQNGFRFFEREPNGSVREFYWRGLKDQKSYYRLLKDVTNLIVRHLLDDGEAHAPL
jgi:hypothetical protein